MNFWSKLWVNKLICSSTYTSDKYKNISSLWCLSLDEITGNNSECQSGDEIFIDFVHTSLFFLSMIFWLKITLMVLKVTNSTAKAFWKQILGKQSIIPLFYMRTIISFKSYSQILPIIDSYYIWKVDENDEWVCNITCIYNYIYLLSIGLSTCTML